MNNYGKPSDNFLENLAAPDQLFGNFVLIKPRRSRLKLHASGDSSDFDELMANEFGAKSVRAKKKKRKKKEFGAKVAVLA